MLEAEPPGSAVLVAWVRRGQERPQWESRVLGRGFAPCAFTANTINMEGRLKLLVTILSKPRETFKQINLPFSPQVVRLQMHI